MNGTYKGPSEFEQRRKLTTSDLQVNDQPAAVARLRINDVLKTPNMFGLGTNNNYTDTEALSREASPERIASALKQQSPLRRKLA